MIVLGISALYHDSAAAMCIDGKIIAAAQEERFSRIKHDNSIPINAIKYCLNESGMAIEDVDIVVYYDNPMLTLDRFLSNAIALDRHDRITLFDNQAEGLFSKKVWIKDILKRELGCLGKEDKFYVCNHHISHAASAFYPSPFECAAILTIDGVGEWDTTTIGIGNGNKILPIKTIKYPHSLGLLYSAFTYYCGFKVNSGDYKFMGLAPYGEPIYYDVIKKHIIDIKPDGSFRLNLSLFDYYKGTVMVNKKFDDLFGGIGRRNPESNITKREMDIAASAQKVTEEVILLLAKEAKRLTGLNNLCLAGGVALNCVANGKILESGIFDNIWIQPAAGDGGGALGCALYAEYSLNNTQRLTCITTTQQGSYLGPSYSREEVRLFLDKNDYKYFEYDDNKLYKTVASYLADNKVVGLFHGRMEYGPRALGNRSIIASPLGNEMQSKINLKIKYRESFRPFAPSVLAEKKGEYFEIDIDSPFMLLVSKVKKNRLYSFNVESTLKENDYNMIPVVNHPRSDIPAVTHVDGSARIQTVQKEDNEYYYRIIEEFSKITGTACIVNTSFNVRGEPIVCSLEDAYRCFMRTEMDVLVIENFVLRKEDQKIVRQEDSWREQYELD